MRCRGGLLDSPIAPVVAERVGEVDLTADLLQPVDCPVPVVAVLDHHLGALAGCHHRLLEGNQVVVGDAGNLYVSLASLRRAITVRRRCKSIPTYCRVCSTGSPSVVSGLVWKPRVCHSPPQDGGGSRHCVPSAFPELVSRDDLPADPAELVAFRAPWLPTNLSPHPVHSYTTLLVAVSIASLLGSA